MTAADSTGRRQRGGGCYGGGGGCRSGGEVPATAAEAAATAADSEAEAAQSSGSGSGSGSVLEAGSERQLTSQCSGGRRWRVGCGGAGAVGDIRPMLPQS